MNKQKVIFLGTPLIAFAALEQLLKIEWVEIVAVITQPDKLLNKKKEIIFQPVKEYCVKNNILVFQPEKISEISNQINELKPDILITCAYGQFIPESILKIPKIGAFNFHASLLPELRGGAPIHWSVINQYKQTGWTLMKMVKKMDAGDYCAQEIVKINDTETYASLYQKLIDALEPFIKNNFKKLIDENTKWIKQNEQLVTFGLNVQKQDRIINFNNSVHCINALIRGLNDKPIAIWEINGLEVKVYQSEITNIKSNTKPGTINKIDKTGIYISTNDFDILFKQIQLPNKNKIFVDQIYHNQKIIDLFFKK